MNGPEHYREAERLLDLADRNVSDNWAVTTGEYKADVLAAAQVHATLAFVAATVATREAGEDRDGVPFCTVADAAWIEATS